MSTSIRTAGRYKSILMLLLVFGPASFLVFISTRGCEHKFKELDDLGTMPNYSLKLENGKQLSAKDFNNQIVLFTTIQKSCPDSCSFSFWHLDQLIYQHLRKNKKKLGHVKLVSIIDDTTNLKQKFKDIKFTLNDRIEAYDSSIWIVATSDLNTLYNHTRNKINLNNLDYRNKLMLLADKQNHLRMVLKGDSEGLIRRMKQHVALLEKQYDKEAAK